MKPIDFRNETWATIQDRLAGGRAAVLEAWRQHGPCSTEQLAERSEISILSLRPRTTELVQLGFVCLAEIQPSGSEGAYRVRSQGEHATWIAQQTAAALENQQFLAL